MLDPTSLPLSADLRARLTEWGQEYALLLTHHAYQWPSAAAHVRRRLTRSARLSRSGRAGSVPDSVYPA